MLTQWDQCHKGNRYGTNGQAALSWWQQSYHKIRCWHESCLMEKTYLYWYHCPPFFPNLRLLYANIVVNRTHTYATIENVSHCWVCTEFPVSASAGLP